METRTIPSHYETSTSDECCKDCSACCTYPSGMGALAPVILSLLVAGLSTAACSTCSFAKVQAVAGTFATNGANEDLPGDLWSDTNLFTDSTTDTTDNFWGDLFTDFSDYSDDDYWDRNLYGLFGDNDISDTTTYTIGLFSREMNYDDAWGYLFGSSSFTASGCVHYSSEEHNEQGALFATAKIIGAICAASSYVIMMTICCIAPCVRLPQSRWRVLGGFLVFFGLCQCFTIVGVLFSATCRSCGGVAEGCVSRCQMSLGGILAAVASALWLISGAICCCITPPTNKGDLIPIAYASSPVSVSVAPSTSMEYNDDEQYDTPNQRKRNHGISESGNRSHLHKHSHSTGSHPRHHRHHHHSRTNHSSTLHHKQTPKDSDSISL